jgi:benzoate transport
MESSVNNPVDLLDKKPMTHWQVLVVILAIGLNALDGIDILAISFAAPGISAEWGINRAALGIVLSMELIGMCVGSILLGGMADSIGRRKTILFCLVLMTIGMFMVTTVDGIYGLSFWRVITGFGIGGMLAAINPIAAEFSNAKNRTLSLSLVVIGYPIGGIICGTLIAPLLKIYDWRSVFYLGAVATLIFIPLVYFWVPESVHWLVKKRPENALAKVNHTLKKLGQDLVTLLPTLNQDSPKLSIFDIFNKKMFATTVIVTLAYLFHITTFYFILKWTPKIVVDMGFAASSAAIVLTWANVGGAIGGALFGFAALRFGLKFLTIAILLASVITISIFGRAPSDLTSLAWLAAIAGFCTNAGVVGLYSIFAFAFPTHVRAFGTGFAIGIGRGGAVISPMIAGFLFNAGISLPTVAMVMAMGSLIAIIALIFLKLPDKSKVSVSD